ncbi:MAG: GNAT family N-acetyltransferase [Ruminococcus sp.]|nr:GNAT family N-acetyltransferase [Ruminococcus sp.]
MGTAYRMKYLHPVDEKPTIEMIPYSPEYREEYKRVYNECYREMREALDIKPYDFIQDDSFFESGMENVYLLTDNGALIGSVAIISGEIDDLIVSREYQRHGFGRQILLWALEHIRSENVTLHVAEWNKKAVSLYKKTGFEIVDTIEF